MGRLAPGEEADDLGLELEDDADAGVEAAEVGGHGGYGEARAGRVGGERIRCGGVEGGAGGNVRGDDLGEESVTYQWVYAKDETRYGYFSRSLSCMLAALKMPRLRT